MNQRHPQSRHTPHTAAVKKPTQSKVTRLRDPFFAMQPDPGKEHLYIRETLQAVRPRCFARFSLTPHQCHQTFCNDSRICTGKALRLSFFGRELARRARSPRTWWWTLRLKSRPRSLLFLSICSAAWPRSSTRKASRDFQQLALRAVLLATSQCATHCSRCRSAA